MLLTVGFINLLSHVSTLVMGGGDPALYLNKLQPVEVIRHWIGESNTSTFQQQQFQHQLKMLLSGGGEGGGIASPIVSRGSGGIIREDQLPRGSKRSMSDSDEQPIVPHLPKTPSKRNRSSFDETNVRESQGFKKARSSHAPLDLRQESSEEQEGTSLQRGKSNISHDSSSGSSAYQGGHDKVRASSKQASQEVQETPSFDDLLTQAIQAVSPQTSSPVKETLQTQVQTQPSGLTPIAKEKRTTVSALTTTAPADAVNQTPEAISVMPVEQSTLATTIQEKMQALTPVPTSSGSTSPSSEPAPQNFRSTKTPLLIESTRQVAPVVIPEPTETDESRKELILAATMATKKFNDLFDLFDNTPELEDVKITSMSNPSSEDSTSQQALSETTESMEIETITSLTKESTIPSDPSALVDPDRQDHQRKMGSVADQLREKFNQRQAKANQTKQQSEEAKPTPSASADSDRQDHQQKMGSVADQLRERFNQRQANSGQNTRNSEETKSDSSASADSAQQQQKRSLLDEMKGFRFNKGPQKKNQTKQKPEERKKSMVDELKERFRRKPGAITEAKVGSSKAGSIPNTYAFPSSVAAAASAEKKTLIRDGHNLAKDSSINQKASTFEAQLREAISKGVSGLKPTPKKEVQDPRETSSATMLQKPAFMKKSELGKKSSLATLATPAAQLDELIGKQEKLEKSIEWHKKNIRKYNPADHLKEIREIKGKIALLKIQVDKEKKAVKPIAQDLASSSVSTDAMSNPSGQGRPSLSSLFSTTQDNLLKGIKFGVQLKHVDAPVEGVKKKSKKLQEPTNDLERKLFLMRQDIEDDDFDDDDSGPSLQNSSPQEKNTQETAELKTQEGAEHQHEEEMKVDVGTPPPPPPSPPPFPVVKEDKRNILSSIQELKKDRLKKVATFSGDVNTDSTAKTNSSDLLSTLGRSFNNLLSSVQMRFGEDDTEPEEEPEGSKQNLPLGSSEGWGADDDEWDD
ncbi:MAG: hypothetical protein K2X02_07280 [Alphaproteobacteria bacterium]|nr:hypothetical protein [Alphaproteobacteria bacterium]